MTWINDYRARAELIANMRGTEKHYFRDWNALEDDIKHKLNVSMARELYESCMDVNKLSSCVILAMLQEKLDFVLGWE